MRAATAVLLAGIATLALVELGARVLIESGWLSAPRPSDKREGYWLGDHPEFGVWHAPGLSYRHQTSCYDVEYRANEDGARDVERARRSDRPRVVVLGDSFLEGWGVPEADRLSNRLEAQTGVEHLNFAMAHFSPYQEYLVYRSLARDFDHTAVLVGILPANDFVDLDFESVRVHAYGQFRYRPYLVGDPPEFRHLDYREPRLRRWLRMWSYAGSAAVAAVEGRARARAVAEVAESGEVEWFYDYDERRVRLLEGVLERLAAEAHPRRVAVILIPTLTDLRAYARRGAEPLSERLRAAGERSGYRVVNLLPAMAAGDERSRQYFLRCDYHWSPLGNAIATRAVQKALGSAFWIGRDAEGGPAGGTKRDHRVLR